MISQGTPLVTAGKNRMNKLILIIKLKSRANSAIISDILQKIVVLIQIDSLILQIHYFAVTAKSRGIFLKTANYVLPVITEG